MIRCSDDHLRTGGASLGVVSGFDEQVWLQARLAEFLPHAARLTLECIGNSDALYHNIEHTMLVTLAGHDIPMGRAMLRHTIPDDYSNFIPACLSHDIGYVRGIGAGR